MIFFKQSIFLFPFLVGPNLPGWPIWFLLYFRPVGRCFAKLAIIIARNPGIATPFFKFFEKR